jgi:hypothetical protein
MTLLEREIVQRCTKVERGKEKKKGTSSSRRKREEMLLPDFYGK